MDRSSSRSTRLAGLAAAVASAVLGACLGFGAAEDFVALLTAIAGAVAAGNLALIGLDLSAGEPAREQVAAYRSEPAVPAMTR